MFSLNKASDVVAPVAIRYLSLCSGPRFYFALLSGTFVPFALLKGR